DACGTCDATCTGVGSGSACGDSTVCPEIEDCDDGYNDACGTCNATCTGAGSGSTCGDGVVCPELESCDDGYTDACGTCNAGCTGPGTGSTCGDGEWCPETEDCDDGYTDACGTCNADCTGPGTGSTCGDGELCPETKGCDDGYTDACGSCNADCTGPGTGLGTCGDGNLCPENNEECDDGNNTLGDGCSPKCTLEAAEAHFLVDQLSLATFRRNIADLASIPAFLGSPTPSRHWSQDGNLETVKYIENKLLGFGYTNVTLDPYTFEGQTRHNVYATKMGTVAPTQMYIVSAHMDSFNGTDITNAPGADDDGSGTALVLEAARVFAKARTDISVRFLLFNNEETGLEGSEAYVASHRALQGTLAEPTWMGDIQHDMILYDHYAVPDADVEYQANNDFGGQAIDLANAVCGAMARYGTMPCEVTDDMNNTDSKSFWNDAPAISVRENRRLAEIGANSNPNYHQPTDLPGTYNLDDYEFGFNIVKMTTGAVAELVNAEPDCNMNNVGDSDDIAGGAPDTNGDGVLDECQDCNTNGTLDPVEITEGTADDCNSNGVPDECDIATGYSDDGNANNIPDECEPCSSSMPPVAETIGEGNLVSTKNRFLSFTAGDVGRSQAIRLTLDDLPLPYDTWNGIEMWVGLTSEVTERSSSVEPIAGFPNFTAATLKCAPFFLDWGPLGTVHVFHEAIVPEGVYTLQAIDNSCSTAVEGSFSEPLPMTTAKWGDTLSDTSQTPPLPPEGSVNIDDVLGILGRFSNVPGAISKARSDLEPACLDLTINVSDVLASLSGFVGLGYPFITPTATDPCDSTCPSVLP
ncbi:MAG: M20/M25/M40 family metallo-hydrolase, partial [Planctomycetes bacterium]|nr:M20/M25/M40 family metallo-hydrolase [Planctomycetota bacterium]